MSRRQLKPVALPGGRKWYHRARSDGYWSPGDTSRLTQADRGFVGNWKQAQTVRAILDREAGTVHKDHGGKLTMALAYPNSYFVGMSSLALQILYREFNRRPDVVCERAFWDPQEAAEGLPLVTLESLQPVNEFGVLAFTISFEMDYFNVVAMLRQAEIPVMAEERQRDGPWPLVIGGGPAISMNPEPLAPLFDAMVIGEAEAVLPKLTDRLVDALVTRGAEVDDDRERLLDALDTMPGIYVPSRVEPSPGGRQIERLWVPDLAGLDSTSSIYTPDTEFADRQLIEIARGCGRGCRFCLAGYVYRPPRELPVERVLALAQEGIARLGAAGRTSPAVGLVSAAVSDHSGIDEIAGALQEMGARITVSSMRTDPISLPLVRALATSGTQTLTVAPEAGTERLRHVINKGQSEDDLLAAVELAQSLGFPGLKLYYMVGHPTEGDEDIEGIVDLTLKARAIFRRNLAINATPFVPKAHTPFQWMAMTPAKIIARRQHELKHRLAKHHVSVSADSPDAAEAQGVLARGDRRLAGALAEAHAPTARAFFAVMRRLGLPPEEYLGTRSPEAFQPWEIIDTGVRPRFLRHEHKLALDARLGHRCPSGARECLTCGACVPSSAASRPAAGRIG